MKIYIAGTFNDRDELRKEAIQIWDVGHEVVSSWLNEVSRPACMDHATFHRKLAIKDIAETKSADLIILDNRQSSGGKNCELGIGLGEFQNKLLWLVGEPTNVFHWLVDRQFKNWVEVHIELKNIVSNNSTKHNL